MGFDDLGEFWPVDGSFAWHEVGIDGAIVVVYVEVVDDIGGVLEGLVDVRGDVGVAGVEAHSDVWGISFADDLGQVGDIVTEGSDVGEVFDEEGCFEGLADVGEFVEGFDEGFAACGVFCRSYVAVFSI